MAAWLDNCRFNPTLGGTTDWTFSTAVVGCNSPALAGAVNGRLYKFLAISADQSQWEITEGAYNSGTGVFARTSVLYNSSGTGTATGQSGAGTKISFTTVPQVAIIGIKEDLISIEEVNSFTAAQRTQARANVGAAINELQNVSFAISAAAGALTIALKDANGNDPAAATPIALSFRNASLTASPNTPTTLEVTAASSVVVPSTSTCGFVSSAAGRLWICGWNDGGTFRLGVFKASDASHIYPLVEAGIASSLQVVAAGNSAGQHYTAGAAVTNKAFRVLGYVEWNATGMTAGTWTTTNLSQIQTFGPGTRLPGEIVQTIYDTTTTLGTTSSTTFAALSSGRNVNVVPTSAANPIRVRTNGQVGDSVNQAVSVQITRTVGAVNTQIGVPSGQNCTGSVYTPVSLDVLDLPNAAAAATVTYAVWGKCNTTGVTLTYPVNGGGASMTIEEIMG